VTIAEKLIATIYLFGSKTSPVTGDFEPARQNVDFGEGVLLLAAGMLLLCHAGGLGWPSAETGWPARFVTVSISLSD
jgi:hypothetical protein